MPSSPSGKGSRLTSCQSGVRVPDWVPIIGDDPAGDGTALIRRLREGSTPRSPTNSMDAARKPEWALERPFKPSGKGIVTLGILHADRKPTGVGARLLSGSR